MVKAKAQERLPAPGEVREGAVSFGGTAGALAWAHLLR